MTVHDSTNTTLNPILIMAEIVLQKFLLNYGKQSHIIIISINVEEMFWAESCFGKVYNFKKFVVFPKVNASHQGDTIM